MRIVATSDTHTKHKQVKMPFEDFDVFIHAGDMTGRGNWHEFISVGNWFRHMRDQFKHRIIVAGNHDWGLEFNSSQIMNDHFDKDVIYLQDKEIIIDGVKFYGCPWMPNFYNWAFMRTEEELVKYYDAIPDDTQVLITHCPPQGLLDRNKEADDQERCGSFALAERIKQLPKLTHHIFGHIHGGYGSVKVNGVSYHNVAALNEAYMYQNKPHIIEVSPHSTVGSATAL
jgi:Icc-related predicted phosphoesterase